MDFTSVASIATAFGTLITLVALIVTIWNYQKEDGRYKAARHDEEVRQEKERKQREEQQRKEDLQREEEKQQREEQQRKEQQWRQDEQRAAQIRQDLRTLFYQSQSLATLLTDGSPLIFAASTIAKELRSRLSTSADREEFWEYFDDEGFLLSVAVVGWHSSSQTALLRDAVSQIEQCSFSLIGKLSILPSAAQVLKNIVADSWSPIIYTNIFSIIKQAFFQKHSVEASVDKLINALTVELQGAAALYFEVRFLDVIIQVNDFIQEVSAGFANLDDSQLHKLSRDEPQDDLTKAALTESIKSLLEELKDYFPTEQYERLFHIIDEVGKSVSKEHAEARLKERQ